MKTDIFQSPDWFQATTLTERIAAWRASGSPAANGEMNRELAERRCKRWQADAPFNKGSFFAQRLGQAAISAEDFKQMLGEPAAVVQRRLAASPEWLRKLERAYSIPADDESDRELLQGRLAEFVFANVAPDKTAPEPPENSAHKEKVAGFLNFVRPLLRQGLAELRAGVAALAREFPQAPFDPQTIDALLFARLPGKLLRMISRTLVLEMNVARMQGQLAGETPEARFEHFVERLLDREIALAILQEYPVLARQLVVIIDNWVTISLEFLRHLCADWPAIRATFSVDAPAVLKALKGDVGDSHRGGRSVIIAEFDSGFKIVYKPRSMAVEGHFQELLRWVNERGEHPRFRTMVILDGGDHGWVEFIRPATCTGAAEVERFYQRQGGYLALLYALYATDFHLENLIAAGEHPVLIDLETLFFPKLRRARDEEPNSFAGDLMEGSILQTLLLPMRDESDGVEMSGLGGAPGQLSALSSPQWQGQGTDEMLFTRKRMRLPGSDNRPTLNGKDVEALQYTETIVAGFTAIYRLLQAHRHELLAKDGLLPRFADDKVRVVLRATSYYGILNYESMHPDMLRDALERDRMFDRLWAEAERLPDYARITPAECLDLCDGDVPIFHARVNSRDLLTSRDAAITNFFEASGWDQVTSRFEQLGESDLNQQRWYIRASMTVLAKAAEKTLRAVFYDTLTQRPAAREELLAEAHKIADRLEELARRGEGEALWIGLSLTPDDNWALNPTGVDLYDGLPGIALFLGYLGAVTGAARYTNMAKAALAAMRKQLQTLAPDLPAGGAFNGWGGVIYAFAHLGALWNDAELRREAENAAETLIERLDKDEHFDLMSGAAGCIVSLLALHRVAPSEKILAAAMKCGDHLLANTQEMPQGLGWRFRRKQENPLTGFSHGAAGIAWALLELAAAAGEWRFREAALSALAFERSLFSREAGNWPDLREFAKLPDGSPSYSTVWCHGAPGIGLGRLLALKHLDDAETRAEIDTAIQTTLARGALGNHSICHGDLGNLELLLQASVILRDPQWQEKANRLAGGILDSMKTHGWVCGNPLSVESPGLMTGLAGIGYGLLRLAEPQRVPSVLALEPPRGV